MTGASLPPDTHMGPVVLRVKDLEGTVAFWRDLMQGEVHVDAAGERAVVRAPCGGAELLRLLAGPDAPAQPQGAPGLYHMALRVPDATALAWTYVALRRKGRSPYAAVNHGPSDSFYYRDPDLNEVEIYADRPPAEWEWEAGEVRVAMEALNVPRLLLETGVGEGPPEPPIPPGTEVGHIHLRVSDLGPAREFYCDRLGFQVTNRSYPGCLFLSAGGYQQHVSVNVWPPRGEPRVEGGLGLDRFTIRVPTREDVADVARRLGDVAAAVEPDRVEAVDPDGIRVVVEVEMEGEAAVGGEGNVPV